MRHPFRASAIAVALALTLAACGGSEDTAAPTTPDVAPESGPLRVCSDIPYEPFEFEDPTSPIGYSGFDIELIAAVAELLGRDVEIIEAGFDALTSGNAFTAGQCDLAISAMTITAERAEQIDFSDVYYESVQSLLVPEGSTIASIADLVAGVRVGVQSGTTGEEYAEEFVPGATIVGFDNAGDLLTALVAGQVDAVLQDEPVNAAHALQFGTQVVEIYETDESYGIAFGKGSPLVAQVNAALTTLRADGTYDALFEKYFATIED
jgi:polar amino acid transport system substrate-binding protein